MNALNSENGKCIIRDSAHLPFSRWHVLFVEVGHGRQQAAGGRWQAAGGPSHACPYFYFYFLYFR